MTLDDSIQGFRLRVLQAAQRSGNVSATCRRYDVSRTVFYRWRARLTRYGADGLHPTRRTARRGRAPELSVSDERRVIAEALAWPTRGPGIRRAALQPRLACGQKLIAPLRGPRRRDPQLPRHGLKILTAQQTQHRLALAPDRQPAPTAAPAGPSGRPPGSRRRRRLLIVFPHLDTPPAKTLSQSSVQENPGALEGYSDGLPFGAMTFSDFLPTSWLLFLWISLLIQARFESERWLRAVETGRIQPAWREEILIVLSLVTFVGQMVTWACYVWYGWKVGRQPAWLCCATQRFFWQEYQIASWSGSWRRSRLFRSVWRRC